MVQKRGRSWNDEDSSRQKRFKERQASIKKQREDYKTERIRELVEAGFTEEDLDERRERYYCMKEHPGRFCSACNPHAKESGAEESDANEGDNEGLSDEEAEISDRWSDTSRDSSLDFYENRSRTYSEIWHTEAEKYQVGQEIEAMIRIVGATATRLKAFINEKPTEKPPIGG